MKKARQIEYYIPPFINQKHVGKDIYLGTASVQIKSFQHRGHEFNPWSGTERATCLAVQPENRTKPEDNITGLWRVVPISWESGTDGRFFS